MAARFEDQDEDDSRIWNAREIARRNQARGGRPLSPVMKTAATACELAHSPAAKALRPSIRGFDKLSPTQDKRLGFPDRSS